MRGLRHSFIQPQRDAHYPFTPGAELQLALYNPTSATRELARAYELEAISHRESSGALAARLWPPDSQAGNPRPGDPPRSRSCLAGAR